MPTRHLIAFLFGFSVSLGSAQDTLLIPDAVIESGFSDGPQTLPKNLTVLSNEVILGATQPSLDGLLESAPGIDARQRGPFGAQTDLSLRGGTFEQVALWVDGIRWSAPHTAHHLLNLPIDPEDLQQVQVVRGGGGSLGSGGMTGGVVLQAGPGTENGTAVSAEGGSYGWNRLRVRRDWGQNKFRHRVSASRASTSGYQDNTDLQMNRVRYSGRVQNDWGTLNMSLGHLSSAFGAQDFYTANFPQQFEKVGLWQGQLTWKQTAGDWTYEAGVHHRNHRDRFELFREGEGYYTGNASGQLASETGPVPSWYQGANLHRSSTTGARGSARRTTAAGESLISVDVRREGVLSNRLGVTEFGRDGDSTYTLGDRRTNLDLAAGHLVQWGRFTARGLAAWNVNSAADQPRFIPEAALTLRIDQSGRAVAFASARRSIRMPSYTDLYYTVGGAQGSQDLLPEEAEHLEFGYRLTTDLTSGHRLVLSQHLFHRWGHNLIDWVRFNGSTITEATNLRQVHFTGQEFTLSTQATSKGARLRYFTLGLTFLQADETSDGFESNYALDVLNTKADLLCGYRLANQLDLDIRWSVQKRNGGYFDPVEGQEIEFDWVNLLGATVRWSPETLPVSFHIRVDNALDNPYVDIGNVNQPGRWVRGGITWSPKSKG
ncbi:TonB-dependent receptor plug domain-containing protein, partial [bacterium]|jgi:vitamin B12 transporter|nr:TonB-dependent receptor plug domain-containing protein [bacterium]